MNDSIADLARDSWNTAERSGWHESTIGAKSLVPEKLLMLHTEISEAVEEYRVHGITHYYETGGKPCGLMTELADIFIRLGDLATIVERESGHGETKLFVDTIHEKMAFNKTRPYRHGAKML